MLVNKVVVVTVQRTATPSHHRDDTAGAGQTDGPCDLEIQFEDSPGTVTVQAPPEQRVSDLLGAFVCVLCVCVCVCVELGCTADGALQFPPTYPSSPHFSPLAITRAL